MSSTKPTLAFFGATGGCACQALALALQNGYNCIALARTPSKLSNLLKSQYSISDLTLQEYLTIHPGDAKSVPSVRSALSSTPSSHNPPRITLPSTIVFGIGGTPAFQLSLLRPVTLTDPTICASAMSTIFSALRELISQGARTETGGLPRVIVISTTGVSKMGRDVPMLLWPVYHWLLQVPHADKARMEALVVDAATATASPAASTGATEPSEVGKESKDGKLISSFTIVRPTLLTDGAGKGLGKVRVGWERYSKTTKGKVGKGEEGPGPAMGYSVSRRDVGRCVTLTY